MTEYKHPKISWTHLLFKKEGRINRKTYWKGVAICVVVSLVLFIATLVDDLFLPRENSDTIGRWLLGYAMDILSVMFVFVVFSVPYAFIGIKRVHDMDRSGEWRAVAYLFGVVGLIYLGCAKGTPGPNSFDSPQPESESQ